MDPLLAKLQSIIKQGGMDRLVTSAIELSTEKASDLKQLQCLFKSHDTIELITSNKDQIDIVLFDALNPSTQTLAYVHFL
jgi:hypothetical protein